MPQQQPPQPPQPTPPPPPVDPHLQQVQSIAAGQVAKPLLTDEEFLKLKDKVSKSYQNMQPQRTNRLRTLKQYVGNSLGTAGDGQGAHACVVNLLDRMVEVYMQKLISGNPQCLILTNKLVLKAGCRYFQLALNHILTQINLKESLRMGVLESLFSMMVMKVGVEDPQYTQRNYPFDASAMPFCDAVWFEDFVYDTSVSRLAECKFMGDKYKASRKSIIADGRNDREVAQNLQGQMTAFDQATGQESASDMGGNKQAALDTEESDDVWLWDIYLPRKKLIVTYPVAGDKPLRVEAWTGHPEGPYRIGRYKLVLNQIMPKPPAIDIAPLSDLDNRLFEKMGQQASRQKDVGFASMAAFKDAEKVVRAGDGEVIAVTHPDAIKFMKFGGADQGLMTTEQVVAHRASEEAGNLDTMGGTATGADTLGQEQILQQSASGRIQMMQQEIINVTKSVITAIAWYLWNDPLVKVSVMDNLPDTDVEYEIQWPKETDMFGQEHDLRQGEFNDLNFTVVPYSLIDMTPSQQLAAIDGTVQQLIPLLPFLQQQGVTVDAQAWMQAKEELSGVKQLRDIIKFNQQLPDPDQQMANTSPGKQNTTRQYDRVVKPKTGKESTAELVSNMGSTNTKPGVA
jgi:hypothetical protein